MKILLLEDNITLAKAIHKKLLENEFIVDMIHDGEEGLYALDTITYDLLILDLGLPSIEGTEIIKTLRKNQKDIPILIISARDKLDQRILGLDLGADDYLCKPFELDEVIARVHALLRRSKQHLNNDIKYMDLVYETQNRSLRKDGVLIELSKRELCIFEYLLFNLNTILSKENIVEQISTIDDDFSLTAVETYISRIRKKLGSSVNLKTVRGLGYMLQ